jgi:hypothetical protein
MKALRMDFVFSYWIYIWYLLYIFTPLNIQYSPKFVLILGLFDNIIMLIIMLLYGTDKKTIFYFIIINIIIKVVPLYYLRNEKIRLIDIYFTFLLFIVFILWLHINKQSLTGNIKLIYDSLVYGKDKTPFMAILKKLKNNYKNLQIS